MKRFSLSVPLVVAGVMFLTTTGAIAQNETKRILWAFEDLQWEPSVKLSGVFFARLRGDRRTGAYEEFVKYPPGYETPLHFHTYDQKIVVVKGGYVYNGKTYGPGSYLLIPAEDRHQGGSSSEGETICYLEQPGKFDFNLVEPPKGNK